MVKAQLKLIRVQCSSVQSFATTEEWSGIYISLWPVHGPSLPSPVSTCLDENIPSVSHTLAKVSRHFQDCCSYTFMKETYWQRSSNAHFIEKNPVLCQAYWVPWSCSTFKHFKRSILALVSVKTRQNIRLFSLSWAQGWIARPRSSWLDDAILANELSAGGKGISSGLRQLIAGWDSPSSVSSGSDAVDACVEIKLLSVWVPENFLPTQVVHTVEDLGICEFCYFPSPNLTWLIHHSSPLPLPLCRRNLIQLRAPIWKSSSKEKIMGNLCLLHIASEVTAFSLLL